MRSIYFNRFCESTELQEKKNSKYVLGESLYTERSFVIECVIKNQLQGIKKCNNVIE